MDIRSLSNFATLSGWLEFFVSARRAAGFCISLLVLICVGVLRRYTRLSMRVFHLELDVVTVPDSVKLSHNC